jgi:hypothetical protein
MWQKGTVALKAERAGSVGKKLAKMERRSIWETWLFVGVDALTGTRCRPIPLSFFFEKSRFVRAPSESWRRLRFQGYLGGV